MSYAEILANARDKMAPKCKVCRVCDGQGCRFISPGPGGAGSGLGFMRNYQQLKKIGIRMDTIYEEGPVDTTVTLFGRTFTAPVFAAPIANVANSYTSAITEDEYNHAIVQGCADAGCAAFTGDGIKAEFFTNPLPHIAAAGVGIPTMKPLPAELSVPKIRTAEAAGATALAMDIDAVAFGKLRELGVPVAARSVSALREIISSTSLPFLLKGIMTPQGAIKAAEAGAYGIVVSNHGGRTLEDLPATCDVLADIRRAVGKDLHILVDGGFRTGADLFKARALGAEGVLIGRPYAIAAFGGGVQGVKAYTDMLKAQLEEAMILAGCSKLDDISPEHLIQLT